ncbi:MAG: cation:proton antiporter, partial [Bacteroidales bacterium]
LPKTTSDTEFIEFNNWSDFLIIFKYLHSDDALWVVMNRQNKLAIDYSMSRIPGYLDLYCKEHSFVLVYPLRIETSENRYFT